tara:strand:- start:173 stop:964 length:792 start_codon:yes stop_codon:yes gene_type:complete
MKSFEGKVVIVTGGGLGIGQATSHAFALEGALVCIADINESAGENLVEKIKQFGGRSIFVKSDVTKSSDCKKIVNETVKEFGGIDVLVNNVGIQPLNSYKNIEDTTEEIWDSIINVNLKSYFFMSKYSIPYIRNTGGGVIVNTASVQGLQSDKLVPAYAASKGGVLSLTRQMSLDYAKENIRVVAVCPGSIDTPLLKDAVSLSFEKVDEGIDEIGKKHPLGRIGDPSEIANAILFLSSEKASFITGEYLCVDGGLMAKGAWGG